MTVPDEAITTTVLQELFSGRRVFTDDSKFENGMMMKRPSTDAIVKLADSCEIMRLQAKFRSSPMAPGSKEFASSFNEFTETLRAVAILHERLPSFINEKFAADAAEIGAPPRVVAAIEAETCAWERIWRAVDDAKQLLSRRYRFDPDPVPPMSFREKSTPNWHEFVDFLTEDFKDAMRSTNPGQELRFSNTGPISRFLEAVIPLISGESVKGGSAIQHLRRKSQEG